MENQTQEKIDAFLNERGLARQEEPKSAAFYKGLLIAMHYPLKGNGKYILIGFAVIVYVICYLSFLASVLGWLLMLLGGAIAGGILAGYFAEVIASTAGGDDQPPGWPNFSEWWTDIMWPLLLILGSFAFSMLPAIGLCWAYYTKTISSFWPIRCFVLLGYLYLPMATLSVLMHNSLAGLNPKIVIRAISKTTPAYLVAFLVLAITVFGLELMIDLIPGGMAEFGGILVAIVGLYFVMVQARILGLLYYTHEKKLDWFVK